MNDRNDELDDLADAAVFLASPASASITGQPLFVGGGFMAQFMVIQLFGQILIMTFTKIALWLSNYVNGGQ